MIANLTSETGTDSRSRSSPRSSSIEEQFRDAMERAGMPAPSVVIGDGKIHRFGEDQVCWYVFHDGMDPWGAFGVWNEPIKGSWTAKSYTFMSVEKQQAHAKRIEKAKRQAEEEESRRHEEARQRAASIWNDMQPASPDHPYLKKKGVSVNGLRVYDGNMRIAGRSMHGALIVPGRDGDGVLWTLEFITEDGAKYFLPGGRKRGCFFLLSEAPTEEPSTICIPEGVATGSSVHEATGLLVAIAFDAGNLRSVAEALRKRFTNTRILICGDNDKHGVGQKAATEAAQAVGGIAVIPETPGEDWNDVAVRLGLNAVKEQIETAIAEAETSTASSKPTESVDSWPALDGAALHGLAGDIVKTIEPHTESDQVAILVQLLVAFGNCLGRSPYFMAEADRHGMNLNAALVGETSKGRKGTSWGHSRRLFQSVDAEWTENRILNGLSSGEGLIWAVRDEITKDEAIREKGRATGEYQRVVIDLGVKDKRLLVLESEFASTLRVMSREGNTLSAIIRQAWDSGNLRTMTKNSPAQATGAHVSIIAHITRDELCRLIDTTEASNGFCNRFLWVCVRRSKVLPEGGSLLDSALAPLARRLTETVEFSRKAGELKRDQDARNQWREIYPALSEGRPGLLGGITSRAEAQVMRLACLYALLDMSYVVTPVHLQAALALWDYCDDSAKYIFGQRLGDPIADEILNALRKSPSGMTRTEIRDWFGRNRKTAEIDRGVNLLANKGLARKEEVQSGGRPIERWFAVATATT